MTDDLGERSKNLPGRVCLWVVPRSVSTTVCRCIGEIPGCEVWFEPLLYCKIPALFLQYQDGEQLPLEYEGNEEVFARAAGKLDSRFQQKFSPERLAMSDVKRSIESSTAKYVFVKDMAHAIIDPATWGQSSTHFIPEGFRHAFLIREPSLVFESLRKSRFSLLTKAQLLPSDVDEQNFDMMTHDPSFPPDRFYESQHVLWKHVRATTESDPIVIDTADLLSKPAEVIPKFCEAVGLPYSASMLEWGSDLESAKKWRWPSDDFINDKHYLGATMTTDRFMTPSKKPRSRDQLTDGVLALAEQAMPFYQEMFESRLKV